MGVVNSFTPRIDETGPTLIRRFFFRSAAIFGCEWAVFAGASDLWPEKTSLCRALTETAQPKVGQPLSAAEYLFSVSSPPRLESVAKFREGVVGTAALWGEADGDHRVHGWPPSDPKRRQFGR